MGDFYNYNKVDTNFTYGEDKSGGRKTARRIYSTKLINQLIEDHNNGYEIPYDAFFQRDLQLRAPNIVFEMTPEEMAEYEKCYEDPLYYVSHYCKFQTDDDYQLVKLRPFQEKVIKTVTEEQFIDASCEKLGPKNRSIIWMAARQSGKCCTYNTLCDTGDKQFIGKIYDDCYEQHKELTFNGRLKAMLYRRYNKAKGAKLLLGRLIEKVEKRELRSQGWTDEMLKQIGEDEKIISTMLFTDAKVMTDTGYEKAYAVHKTRPYRVYIVKLENGMELECADRHKVFTIGMTETFVKDLNPGDLVMTEFGYSRVKSVTVMPYKLCMYDIEVSSLKHRYYTNGILSHNTTTISSFMSWMLIFHSSRNILLAANKEDTAKEIVDKITKIFKNLPFFLKPGCESFGKTGLILENQSKILSTATTNTASIGFTIHCMLLDEFAHIPVNIVDNFWRSVYPTLSSSQVSQCIITSTPNGTTNKFYEIWSKSIEGKNSFVNIRTDYWEVPEHDEAWAAKQRADFGDDEFAQEFELQFNVNSKMLLDATDMQFIARISKQFVPKKIFTNSQYLNVEGLTWHPDFDPNNIDRNAKYVILVDLAEGNEDADNPKKNKKKTPDSNALLIFKVIPNSVANVRRFAEESCNIKDCFRFVQIGKYTSNMQDEVYTAKVAAALTYELFQDNLLDDIRVCVEMNFNGKSFTSSFMQHPMYSESSLFKTYHTKPVPNEVRKKKIGFKTTTDKEFYCLKGKKLIKKRRIIITDIETKDQLQSFGYVKGKIKGIACHDDLSYPSVNHIARMLEESNFEAWLSDYLYMQVDAVTRFALNQLIEKWALDNPEMSDAEFNEMFTEEQQPYGMFGMNPIQTGNPYSQSGIQEFSYSGGYSSLNPYTQQGQPTLNPYTGML